MSDSRNRDVSSSSSRIINKDISNDDKGAAKASTFHQHPLKQSNNNNKKNWRFRLLQSEDEGEGGDGDESGGDEGDPPEEEGEGFLNRKTITVGLVFFIVCMITVNVVRCCLLEKKLTAKKDHEAVKKKSRRQSLVDQVQSGTGSTAGGGGGGGTAPAAEFGEGGTEQSLLDVNEANESYTGVVAAAPPPSNPQNPDNTQPIMRPEQRNADLAPQDSLFGALNESGQQAEEERNKNLKRVRRENADGQEAGADANYNWDVSM